MGCQNTKDAMIDSKQSFRPTFSVNLKKLFDYYLQIAQFAKQSKLFSASSKELNDAVDKYISDPENYDKGNFKLRAINAICKLSPLKYRTSSITKEWIVAACIKHNHFVDYFPLKKLNFEQSYKDYVEFLYLCFKEPKKKHIVANKLADFMWHSHMQDNQNYKLDMIKMLGCVLDHKDAFQDNQIKAFMQQTEEIQAKHLKGSKLLHDGSISYPNEIDYNFEYLSKLQIDISKIELMKLYTIASDGDYGGIYSHASERVSKRKI